MPKNLQQRYIFVLSLMLSAVFVARVQGDGLTDNHWILRKKREGGSLWLVDKKKQPQMEIEGGVNDRWESIPAGRVADPVLREKLLRFSINAKREVKDSKSLSRSTQDHYGILIEQTTITPEMPDYAHTAPERASRPWPNGVNLDKEFADYKPPFPVGATIQVTVYNREGKAAFEQQFSGSAARADIDDSQNPAWLQLYLGDKKQPQLIELKP